MSAARHELARHALARIPKILTLQDRNPHSATYGCFDRNFWHYRIIDFPSGMSQEFVYPLALAFTLPMPGNPYHGSEAVREWVRAGIHYAARSAHADGSCDDYFPFERAMGAAAFSLLACAESATLLDIRDEVTTGFLRRRADWLAAHDESGRLSNHQALTVLALDVTGRLLGTERWSRAANRRLSRLLDWQHEEGWFPEYEGCDPGYHTLTIGCLAQLLAGGRDGKSLQAALERSVALASELVHPDGSYGGEYGSRNTYNFFPHGFEIAGDRIPSAPGVNDLFLHGLRQGRDACLDDDHLIGHHTWSYLLAWRHWQEVRPGASERRQGRTVFKGAGLVIDRRSGSELYVGTGKGGVFKLFRHGEEVVSDTGISLRVMRGGRQRTAVMHLGGDADVRMTADVITISGRAAWARDAGMTTRRLVVLRLGMLSVGRFFPNLVRRTLQRMLITGRNAAPFRFSRTLRYQDDGRFNVRDEVHAPAWDAVLEAGIGGAQTSIYVVMSRVFQRGQLQPWLDLTPRVRALKRGAALVVDRTI